MTLAAGILTTDGALLFSDSQFANVEKENKPKIRSEAFEGLTVAFVMSGDEDYAITMMDDSFQAIRDTPPEQQSVRSAVKAISNAIRPSMEDYKKSGLDQTQKPEFVLAISSPSRGPQLFAISSTSIPSVDHFTFRGSGNYLAKYVMNAFSLPMKVPMRETVLAALYALTAAKRYDAFVGGGSQFLALRGMSAIGISYFNFQPEESQLIDEFERSCGSLLCSIVDTDIKAEALQEKFKRFSSNMTDLHNRMTAPGTAYSTLIANLCQEISPRSSVKSQR